MASEDMAHFSPGQYWVDLHRKRQQAESRELETQKAAVNRAVRAEVGGLQTLTSYGATIPDGRSQQSQDPRPSSRRRRENVPELEAQDSPPLRYRQQSPLTPPASDGEAYNANDNMQIIQLQKEVTQRENNIEKLESKLEAEKDRRRRLQAERHEAVDAQRKAEVELGRLEMKVANLNWLLDESIQKEKDLEKELDAARQKIAELKRQLHDEQCSYESDIRARDVRERRISQQLEDRNRALESEIQRASRNVGSVQQSETQCEKIPHCEVAD